MMRELRKLNSPHNLGMERASMQTIHSHVLRRTFEKTVAMTGCLVRERQSLEKGDAYAWMDLPRLRPWWCWAWIQKRRFRRA